MKKVLGILLAVLMLASVIPFGIAALESKNAQTEGVPAPDLAYTTIGNAIATDAANGTTTELAKTNWSFQYGESKNVLIDRTISEVGDFGVYDYAKNVNASPRVTPKAYRFSNILGFDHIENVAAYNSETLSETKVINAKDVLPPSGVIFSVSQRKDKEVDNYFALTYTAPQTGSITINDPDGGMITTLWRVGYKADGTTELKPNCVYLEGRKRDVKFGIYKNGERIWPAEDDFLFYHNTGGDRVFAVSFPTTLEDIDVRKGDKIQFIFDGSQNTENANMTFALNPQVTYRTPDRAYETIGNALELDSASKTITAIADTDWSFSRGESLETLDENFVITSFGEDFGFYRNVKYITDTITKSYIFQSTQSYYRDNIAVYNRDTADIASPNRTGLARPATGVVFGLTQINGVSKDNCFSINYTAPIDGYVNITDPDDGYVANIDKVANTSTSCADDNGELVNFAIYKNNDKIWPTDSNGVIFEKGTYYHKFPTIERESVKKGDVIKIVFENISENDGKTFPMTFALNPQIEYVYPDTGDVNSDWDIDIRDLVAMNKQLDKAESKYDSIFDLFRGDGKFSVDKLDLGALRDFIVGKITEF